MIALDDVAPTRRKARHGRPKPGHSTVTCHDFAADSKKVGLECSRYNLPCSIYKNFGAKSPQFLTFQQLKMAGNKEVVADSDSEWGSDVEEDTPKNVAREEVESGDETEELASETEDEDETDDEAEARKAAEAKAKKKADALKAKKAAEAKAKKESEAAKLKPAAKPKVVKSPSKKRKAEGEKPPAASKPSAESKKDSEAPAKPKAVKPPEVFATQPLKDGTREGMSAQEECDAFLAHIRAKNNEHQSAVDTFIKAAFSDKGKQPKSTVSTLHSIFLRAISNGNLGGKV